MLPQGGPYLNSAVMAWARDTRVFVTAKYQDDYQTEITFKEQNVRLFRAPSGQALEFKMTGQRSFNNEKIFADISLDLNLDAVIMFDNENNPKYRVINKTDYSGFGFIEYDIQSDYV
jgi:hypothetical protein